MLFKEVLVRIFHIFGMTRPGIEPASPGPLANSLLANEPIYLLIPNNVVFHLQWQILQSAFNICQHGQFYFLYTFLIGLPYLCNGASFGTPMPVWCICSCNLIDSSHSPHSLHLLSSGVWSSWFYLIRSYCMILEFY